MPESFPSHGHHSAPEDCLSGTRGGKHARYDRHGNPEELQEYIARLEDPEREQWQMPDRLVAALRLSTGATVAELGGGTGYFALRLARAVGPAGRVLVVEVEPRIAEVLLQRLRDSGLRNVTPVLALSDDPLLPDGSCDLALLVNSFHHVPDEVGYLRRLVAALRPGGRIANVDFHAGELPFGPPPEHKVSRERFLALAGAAGLEALEEHSFLPYQYFIVLRPGS